MMTDAEIAEARSQAAALLGRKGGERRAERLSPKRRAEIARNAALARWAKERPEPDPTGTDPAPSKVASLADAARARGRKISPPAAPVTAREAGRKGGQARASRMTPEERSAAAQAASLARWRCQQSSSGRWVVALPASEALRIAANDGATDRAQGVA